MESFQEKGQALACPVLREGLRNGPVIAGT